VKCDVAPKWAFSPCSNCRKAKRTDCTSQAPGARLHERRCPSAKRSKGLNSISHQYRRPDSAQVLKVVISWIQRLKAHTTPHSLENFQAEAPRPPDKLSSHQPLDGYFEHVNLFGFQLSTRICFSRIQRARPRESSSSVPPIHSLLVGAHVSHVLSSGTRRTKAIFYSRAKMLRSTHRVLVVFQVKTWYAAYRDGGATDEAGRSSLFACLILIGTARTIAVGQIRFLKCGLELRHLLEGR